MIAIHKHGIRDKFRDEAIEEAKKVAKLDLGEREDLTHLPIVAIDPEDARDHDDAIWASAARTWPSFNEQMSDDNSCGSIGRTWSGK